MATVRAREGDTPCSGIWPLTGNPCRNAARAGLGTCVAHDPGGDPRPTPPEEFRCTATNKESGERCRRQHAPGGVVCAMHGGNAPQARAEAKRRATEARLDSLATDLTGRPVGNALTELSRLAGRARAWMQMLEERVQALLDAESAPSGGDEEEQGDHGIRYYHRAGEQTRAEVQLYERAMGQLGSLLTSIARLNIDERLARITERQAEAVIAALEAGLTAAGVRDPEQRTAAKAAASRELRLVR
jgi:hypothetical protein